MTVYEFMKKMGRAENFHIFHKGKCVTLSGATSVQEVDNGSEDRQEVLEAVEMAMKSYDARFNIIDTEE